MTTTAKGTSLSKAVDHLADEVNNQVHFSASEICDIIKSCKKHGVSSFKFNGLALTFGDQPKETAAWTNRGGSKRSDLESSEEGESPDLDQLMVEDPGAYERILAEQQEANEDN